MTNHNKSQLYQEIEWIFTSFIFAEHCEVHIKNGKVTHSKYHEKQKDTKCYVCDIIRKLKIEVLKEINKAGVGKVNK